MKQINVLSLGFTSPNSAAFLYPFIMFKRSLKAHGFNITLKEKINEQTTQCDYLLIDSKFFKHRWTDNFDHTLQDIAALNAQTKVIWCDQADSTGTFLGQVVPHVHRYLKAQLLKDRREYLRLHYASRIYTDYYHKKHGIDDEDPYIKQTIKNPDDLKKLGVSWNSCFMHYGLIGPYLMKLRARIPCNAILHFPKHLTPASIDRPMDISCRMGISYTRNTVCYQRQKIRDTLARHIPTDKISRRAYFKELEQSKICISPFGLGEITLKDFECFLSGSLLIKPNMEHMETWPNLYEKDKTYIAHDWDMEMLEERIDWALTHEEQRIKIAQNAQDRYIQHTIGKDAPELFAQNFKNIIS